MKKTILFLWFGDEKPIYIQWTMDNFRKMNPGWEIKFIEYSTQQIQDFKKLNDPIMDYVMSRHTGFNHVNFLADEYRMAYLRQHTDELIVYCDLDCFPIAPFDNFICTPDKKMPEWASQGYFCSNVHEFRVLGSCARDFNGTRMFKNDLWCLANNRAVTFNQFIQIHKESRTNGTLTFHNGIMMNPDDVGEYEERKRKFARMELKLGDSFCLPQFTPIEHYYLQERITLNKGDLNT